MKLKIERLPKNDMLVEGCWHGCWISNSPMVKTQDRSVTGSSRRCIHIGSWQRSYQRSRKQMASRLWIPNHDTTHWPLTEQIIPSCVVCNSSVSSGLGFTHSMERSPYIFHLNQMNFVISWCFFTSLLKSRADTSITYASATIASCSSHSIAMLQVIQGFVEVCALASDVKQSERSPKPEDSQRFQTISFCISKFPKVSWVRLYHPISRSLWLIFGGEYVTFTKADP